MFDSIEAYCGGKLNLRRLHLCLASLLLAAATAAAQEQTAISAPEKTWQSAGVRAGFSSRDFPRDPFLQSELFNIWNLPWRWRLCDTWTVKPRLELTAGCLSGKEENGFVGTLGPELAFQSDRVPIVFDAGVRPTWLSRYSFGYRDLGLHFQFTSYVGLGWEFSTHWKIGYRFQHMSNAGLGTPNPGLNLHMFELGYRF
jgi:lipid A 3-O-deacylase